MDGKILFVKYGNFIRRVPVDRVIPAEQYKEVSEDEVDPDDVDNFERLEDDEFKGIELLAMKDKEIEMLKQMNKDKEKQMEEILSKLKTVPLQQKTVKKSLPKNYQKIQFQMDGDSRLMKGKLSDFVFM